MKKILSLMSLLVLSSLVAQKVNKNNNSKKPACPIASWRSADECKAEEGNWIDESGQSCKAMEDWNPKPSDDSICCAGCTDDSMEEMGID